MQIDENSKRLDYRGRLRTLIQGASDAPHGGQVLLAGSEAFDGIKTRLPELLALVPSTPDYKELEAMARWPAPGVQASGVAIQGLSLGSARQAD